MSMTFSERDVRRIIRGIADALILSGLGAVWYATDWVGMVGVGLVVFALRFEAQAQKAGI